MPTGRAGAESRRDQRLNRLLEGPIGPTLARLAAPNVVVSLCMTAVTVADVWYVGHLGVAPLAALALVFPVQAMMQMMSAGAMGGGVSSSVARALGAGDGDRAESAMVHALVIAAAMAALYTLLFAVLARPLFSLLGGRGEALEGAVGYARIMFGGAIVIWFANITAAILRGTGNMMTPAVVLVVISAIGVFLSGALTLGWFGFPALGVRGPAAAYVSTFAAAALFMLGYLLSGRAGFMPSLRGSPLRWERFADILKVGAVACGNALLTIATIVIVTGLVGRYGTAALAGYGLGSRLELILIPLSFGAGGALTAMVGASRGAGRHARARRVAWTGGIAIFVLTGLVGLVAGILPDLWIGLLTSDPHTTGFARSYLHIVGPFYGFFGLGMTLYFASQGTGNMIWPFTAGVVRIVVAAGIGAIATLWLGLSLEWLFALVALGLVLFGGLIAASLFGRIWNPERRRDMD